METKKLKEKYEEATAEVILLDKKDIVTTSDTSLDPDGNYDDKAWT
jgi:hypothetical protein